MAGEVGTAYVGVSLDTKAVQSQLAGLSSGLTKQMGPLGGAMSAAMSTPWTAAAAAAVGGAAIIGKKLYEVGKGFDDMADSIQVATGATGKELKGLTDIAKEVGTSVPTSFQDAGDAVGELAARTGLAGPALKKLSVQVVSLAKITDSDLNQTIEASTRLLGDWGLKGKDASEGLDTLFAASQETGVGVVKIGELMTKYGAPLRNFGISFEQAAAMMGSFERAGVNTGLVTGSLRIALGKLADEGKKPGPALLDIISKIKELGPGAKSTSLAMELFGKRAGADMVDAITGGKFEIEDLTKKIANSKATIVGAEKSTRDFTENWQIFKNQVAVGLAPLAERLFDSIGKGMAYIAENAPPVIAALKEDLAPAFESVGEAVTALVQIFQTVWPLIEPYVMQTVAAIRLIAEVVAGVVQLVAALLRGDWSGAWDAAQKIAGAFVTYFRSSFENLKAYILGIVSIFGGAAKAIGEGIKNGVMIPVNALVGLARTAINAVVSAVRSVLGAAGSAGSAVGNGIKTAVLTPINLLVGLVKGVFNGVVSAIRGVLGSVRSAASAVGNAVVGGLRSGLSTIGSVITTALGKISSAITTVAGQAAGWAKSIGTAIVSGVLSGLSGLFDSVKDKIVGSVSGAIGWARGHLGSTAEEYAAKMIGLPIMAGAVQGIVQGQQPLSDKIAEVVRNAVEAGRTTIEAARATMSTAWGTFASDALQAFDAINAQFQTKAEKAIAQAEERRARAARNLALSEAQAALEKASSGEGFEPKEGETPEEAAARQKAQDDAILAAKKAVAEAEYQIWLAAKTKLAAEQRKERDAQVALKRRHFEEDLAALQARLAKTGASEEQAQKQLTKLLKQYGVEYAALGKSMGKAFSTQLKESIDNVADEIEKILKRIRDAIEDVRKAAENVKAPEPAKGKGKSAPAAAPAPAGLFAAPTAQAAGAGGGLAGPVPLGSQFRRAFGGLSLAPPTTVEAGDVQVRVYIGDRELTHIVRTEVVRSDTGLARSLLRGARS